MELVYMDGKKNPYTLSSIVAECAEIKHRHLKILLNKHREDFERFGKVTFKISPSESGQNVRDYILNEQQATLLITYLRNTEPVRNFKTNLVKAFFEMRDELAKFKLQRALEKPKRKTLHDSIKNWEQKPKHAHSTITHEDFFNRNVENLLGELKKYDDECTERHGKAPDWLLFSFLDQAIKENNLSDGIIHTTASTWTYLRSLVVADLRKRGLLK